MTVKVNAVRRLSRAAVVGALAVGLAVGLAACGPAKPTVVPSDEGVTPAVTVQVIDNKFVPADVQVAPGEAVRWVFEGVMEHDVVARDRSFVSGLMSKGSYTHVFGAVGEFAYDCSIHPEMTGSVTVR